MSGFGQSSTFGGGSGGFGGGAQFPSTPSSNTGGGFGASSTPLAFGQQQQQPFGSSATTTAFGSGGGGFGSPAPSGNPSGTTGFGTTPASSATPFGSSSTTTTSTAGAFGSSSSSGFGGGGFGLAPTPSATTTTTSTPSFGFGQQQQQQQTSGFGTSSTTNNTNVFGSSSSGGTATAAPTMAFGSSSTVVAAQPSATPAAPSSSFFGAAATPSTAFGNSASSSTTTTATPFGGASGSSNTATATAPPATPFGSSSTAFGGTPSTNTAGGFSSSAGGGFGSSTGATVAGGFGSSSSTTTTAAGGGSNLSANATAFTPSASSATTTGGFGSSSTGSVFGGGGFGSSVTGDKTTNSNSSGFGGGFGGHATTTTATTSTSSAFGGGGFGTSTTSTSTTSPFGKSADGNTGGTNESSSTSSSSFPFGARIPRKEKAAPQTAGGGGDASKPTPTEGDAQLAALRAKIQEKKQMLLDKKKNQKQHQQQNNSPARGMSPPRTTADSDRNAELAAKNALRFASQQENKALSSLLPSDLQGRTQAESNDGRTVGDAGNTNGVGDDDDLTHRNVNNAKSLIGICMSMCPDEELIRREKEGDIQLLEITDPGGIHPANWTLRDTAVKRFRRSAADFKLDIPELVRPPEVLERVCGYLEEWVMERDRQGPDKRWAQAATTTSDTPPPLDVYQFIWDRTRMIRKDFILQNYIGTGGKCDARAVRCHERIARWHAMCEHQLSHIPDFVKHQSQQNIAELGQTMKTLNLYYDDALGRALTEPASSGGSDSQGCVSDIVMGKSPIDFDNSALSNDAQSADVLQRIIGKNGAASPSRGTAEPEMRGLYILLTMNNEGGMEVLKYSGRLCTQKPDIFYSKPVQLALTIFRAKKDHNYAKFFRLLRCPSTPYLYACIMFKYVENMRKETLIMMSKVYGAKHKTTGEAFYDSYPLEELVNLLCYEDESEAIEACRHYGITVEGDQVLWRHSKFREPRDPEKGIIIPLKPRKMIRTIESKLNGATRLSVCRGGVSGQGATLSGSPTTTVDAEALLKERQKAQEAMKQKLAEAKAKEEAERIKQEKIKRERMRQERLAAEKRAKEEAAKRAEQERMRKEQLERERLERERKEQERIAAEEKARKEAAERAERLRLKKEAKEKKEREIAEARRLAEEERKRKLAEEERIRRLQEEKRRREEEERRRIAREAELRRKAEEERIRKAKEEEERRIEMAWRQKVENARKVLIFRLLHKQMRRHDSSQKSRNSLSKLDPTCTQYPTSRVELCQDLFCGASSGSVSSGTEVIVRKAGSCDELESQLYRLATSPRQPMNLSELIANSMPSFVSRQAKESYPPVVRRSLVKLFKLAILLPKRTPQYAQLYDTLRMWVESHLILDEANCSCTRQIDVRAVTVIGNEDESHCKNCDAALVLLPSFANESASINYSEQAQELLDQNIPRMVLVLDTEDASQRNSTSTERLLDTILSEYPDGVGLQREGVAAPNLRDFDNAFQKCCQALVQSYVSATAQIDNEDNSSMDPSLVRVPLSDLGFLCLQQLIRNLDENRFFNNAGPNSHDDLFDLCRNALSSLSHELSSALQELHQQCQNWPAHEFFDSERGVESFFGEGCDLPANWYELNSELGSELKQFFQHLLERSTLTLFVESIIGSLSQSLQHDLLIMLDNGEISSCFSAIVTMVVSGEINLVSDGQTILYLPFSKLRYVVEHAAAYKSPEPVEQDVDIPDYLLYGFPSIDEEDAYLEEKENRSNTVLVKNDNISTGEKRTRTPAESEDNTISKRSRFSAESVADTSLRFLQDRDEGAEKKKLKRTKLNDGRKIDSKEERSSKSFTSYLEALLGGGGDVQL